VSARDGGATAGAIVGAALVGHVPTLLLDEPVRRQIGGGADTTLVAGFDRLRERLDAVDADTLIIIDTHWFTTAEHIVAGQAHHRGTYTSDELPKVIRSVPYDYPGAPELATAVARLARERGQWVLNATNDDLAHHYPTLNVLWRVHRGERVLSTGVCQTAEAIDFLDFGRTIADAVAERGDRAVILASGGMSHRFWPLRQFREHAGYGPEHVVTPAARAIDERLISLMEAGDHAGVLGCYDEFRDHSPEGLFGHYLTMAGALGGDAWRTPGERLSEYESSYGTGQVHVWFDTREGATEEGGR